MVRVGEVVWVHVDAPQVGDDGSALRDDHAVVFKLFGTVNGGVRNGSGDSQRRHTKHAVYRPEQQRVASAKSH